MKNLLTIIFIIIPFIVLGNSDLEKIKPILGDQSFRNTDMSIAAPIDIEE